MSLKTAMNKGGVRLKQHWLIILSCPYTLVFCFANAQPRVTSFPGALLRLCASPKSKKRMVWCEITGWLLDNLVLI